MIRSGGPGKTGSLLSTLAFVAGILKWDVLKCSKLSETFGMKKIKPGLKADAVPTLFERSVPKKRASSKSTTDHEPVKKRTAYEKRERARVSNSCNT